jgi:hypothetical protein
MRNEFLIYIKLLQTGKCVAPPCELQPQIAVNLFYYIEGFKRETEHHPDSYKKAVAEILNNLYQAYQTPLGWSIEMQSFDEFLSEGNDFYQPKKRYSKEFLFSPAIGKTKIEIEFMWQWVIESRELLLSHINLILNKKEEKEQTARIADR